MNKVFIPISIVVAGLIIGGAVVLTNKTGDSKPEVVQNEKPKIELSPVTNEDNIKGNPDAEVLIVEYSDFECPFCAGFHVTMERIMQEYGDSGKVAWVYRNMPLDQIHKKARPAAEAAACVSKIGGQEKFWSFSSQLYANQSTNLETEKMKEIAISLGINADEYTKCVTERQTKERVERDYQDGLNIAKLDPNFGTPYNIVITKDGAKIPIVGNQPYASVKQIIDTVLEGK